MGYGCCNQNWSKYEIELVQKQVEEQRQRIYNNMTEDNYESYLTREYMSNWHWSDFEYGGVDYDWTTYIAIEKGLGLDKFINSADRQIRAAALSKKNSISAHNSVTESEDELDKLIHSEDAVVRAAAAEKGFGLDILINDESVDVRRAVAEQGYKTDILVNDPSTWVRRGLAESGYELELLMFDDNFYVNNAARKKYLENIASCENAEEAEKAFQYLKNLPPLPCSIPGFRMKEILEEIDEPTAKKIIEKGYWLEHFLNDKNEDIRRAVAEQGYGLETLINDEHKWVRKEVVKQGYGLDKLINDKDEYVRREVAKQGYGLDTLIDDEDMFVRGELVKQGYRLDILVNDDSDYVREEVAKQGYRLDILVNDDSDYVRKEVAKQGYALEKLVNDKSKDVRREVAKQGYGLEVLVNDEDENVRTEVANKGYKLDILVNDESYRVINAVIDQGYALNDFLYDKAYGISNHALKEIVWRRPLEETIKIVDKILETNPEFVKKIDKETCMSLMRKGFPLKYFLTHGNNEVQYALIDRDYALEHFMLDGGWDVKSYAIKKMLMKLVSKDDVIELVDSLLEAKPNFINTLSAEHCMYFMNRGCPSSYFENHKNDIIRNTLKNKGYI